jgi:hypothetical protein
MNNYVYGVYISATINKQMNLPIFTKRQRYILYICTEYSIWIGLVLRLFLAWFLPWLLDHNTQFLPGVDYTDIDLYVLRCR